MSESRGYYRHGLRRMDGRNIHESGRASTPLELIFDLTFAASFAVAGGEFAHGIAEGHAGSAAGAFCFAMVAIVWAWINYSWFASAFDTDDWLFRILTMVQMSGVIVLAIGLPPMFASIEAGEPLDNGVMVSGYVIMRIALIAQWLRAAKGNPQFHLVAKTYAICVGIAQLGWVLVIFLPLNAWEYLGAAIIVSALDWGGPIIAERVGWQRGGGATPWHAHHIAERYSLLAIIAIGETVIGTLSAAQSITAAQGWAWDSMTVIALGVILGFALWWIYFMVPSAPILHADRSKAFPWGYGHVFVFGSIAAVGAGLHVVGYVYDEHYHVSTFTAICAIAIPVLIFMVSLYLLHSWLVSGLTRNSPLQLGTLAMPVLSIVLAGMGLPLWVCLTFVALSPVGIIVSYELGAWRGLEEQVRHAVERGERASAERARRASESRGIATGE